MADNKDNVSGNNPPKVSEKPAKNPKGGKEGIVVRLKKWFNAKKSEYVAEFKRIVWPTREQLIKETITVIAVSIMFGIYVAILDGVFGTLFSQFAQFTSKLFTS